MIIRKCEYSDVDTVYNLICELEDTKFVYEDFRKIFNNKINDSSNYFILCLDNDNIIGFLSLNIEYQLHHVSKVATIEELIVSSKYRSNGAGKLLLDNAISYAKKQKCTIIELTSSFERERAHNFYIKNGFKKGSFKFKMSLDSFRLWYIVLSM